MKFIGVLVCVSLALLGMTEAGVVPFKAVGLSFKDKLALEVPVKHHVTDKTAQRQDVVKAIFPTTVASTTTTTTSTKERPQYVDAAVFRHQFTTTSIPTSFKSSDASISSSSSTSSSSSSSTSVSFSVGRLAPGFKPSSSAPEALGFGITSSTTPKTVTTIASSNAEALVSAITLSTTPKTTTTTENIPVEDDSYDYDAHFRVLEDLSPFGGELGGLGDDRRASGFIRSFRPLGF